MFCGRAAWRACEQVGGGGEGDRELLGCITASKKHGVTSHRREAAASCKHETSATSKAMQLANPIQLVTSPYSQVASSLPATATKQE
ncbi:hypothetical protein GQF01_23305 [Paenibacillus sp. 5J-6]|uniref:Uncharacterized protein n=1 Tax=Paenibacillus silvestris TaxID=2606219 RepID=A0A6L8V620_9BACL|nr:hypothetical protein [Paenibacillus silvestris]MZQ85046.1 hypothetical protein [Paenibacillus silvestris]